MTPCNQCLFEANCPDCPYKALAAWENWYSKDSTEFNREMARNMGIKALARTNPTKAELEHLIVGLEHRLEVATGAMKDWSERNSELRRQNREKNERIVQLREELAQADSARIYAQNETLCKDKQLEAHIEALRQFILWAPRGWSLELDQALTHARQCVAAALACKPTQPNKQED